MPRGIPNKPKPAPPAPTTPEPLIIMQPEGDGWQFNAYGLDIAEILRALRLSLIHLAATQAGVTTIEAVISPCNIVMASPASAARRAPAPGKSTKPAQRSNGRRPLPRDYDEDEDPDEIDLRELMEEDR